MRIEVERTKESFKVAAPHNSICRVTQTRCVVEKQSNTMGNNIPRQFAFKHNFKQKRCLTQWLNRQQPPPGYEFSKSQQRNLKKYMKKYRKVTGKHCTLYMVFPGSQKAFRITVTTCFKNGVWKKYIVLRRRRRRNAQ